MGKIYEENLRGKLAGEICGKNLGVKFMGNMYTYGEKYKWKFMVKFHTKTGLANGKNQYGIFLWEIEQFSQ